MPADVVRIVEQVDKATARREREVTRALRSYIEEAHRRLKREVRDLYRDARQDVRGRGRIYREARARMIVDQLGTSLAAFDLADPRTGVPDIMRDVIVLERQQGADDVAATLSAAGDTDVAAQMVAVNLTAAEMQVANAQNRLRRYSRDAIDKINATIVDGLVRGDGVQAVQREIAKVITAPATLKAGERIPPGGRGGLAFRAETIARTELISSLEDAREQAMTEADVDLAIWVATDDERTCAYCAGRDGNAYRLRDIILPAHPRCRCATAPMRREWVDTGALDVDALRAHQDETRSIYEDVHGKDARYATGPSPFEKAAGMTKKPQPVWTPASGWAA